MRPRSAEDLAYIIVIMLCLQPGPDIATLSPGGSHDRLPRCGGAGSECPGPRPRPAEPASVFCTRVIAAAVTVTSGDACSSSVATPCVSRQWHLSRIHASSSACLRE